MSILFSLLIPTSPPNPLDSRLRVLAIAAAGLSQGHKKNLLGTLWGTGSYADNGEATPLAFEEASLAFGHRLLGSTAIQLHADAYSVAAAGPILSACAFVGGI